MIVKMIILCNIVVTMMDPPNNLKRYTREIQRTALPPLREAETVKEPADYVGSAILRRRFMTSSLRI